MTDYSQNAEQAVILDTLKTIGIERGHLVDLGAGDGVTMSNTQALIDAGWSGLRVDGNAGGGVISTWITLDWINRFFSNPPQREHLNVDFLSIDLDGNDYHFLNTLLGYITPSLIVAEINPIFDRNDAKVMPYNEAHVWNNDTYYGMSLAACEKLAKQYGYTLMHLHAGINAFLLRNDHAEAHPELIRPIEYKVKHDHRAYTPEKQWITL